MIITVFPSFGFVYFAPKASSTIKWDNGIILISYSSAKSQLLLFSRQLVELVSSMNFSITNDIVDPSITNIQTYLTWESTPHHSAVRVEDAIHYTTRAVFVFNPRFITELSPGYFPFFPSSITQLEQGKLRKYILGTFNMTNVSQFSLHSMSWVECIRMTEIPAFRFQSKY